ncbi:hypothetical protein NC99_46500 [Sunxiuqinia dokdonensis]|uniref:Uncharacterized protein n=1 Tax=Sunxiuqinia dokdonensis TaxID=1409788 RepID=A0A0L8V2W0_9BACT|nr:hypothetical protein NC99_46500 [Sunxiuqinia dokdonensis]
MLKNKEFRSIVGCKPLECKTKDNHLVNLAVIKGNPGRAIRLSKP